MCCYGFGYPTSVGYKIANLTRGTEIIILAGEGYPQVQKDTVDIIWIVAGYSALTAGGIMLSCQSVSDIILTDRHFDTFPITDEAKRIQKEVDELLGEEQDNPPSEPE